MRREFTRNQREQIVCRAMNAAGEICCEKCGLVLGGKPHEIDHVIPEALRPEADKRQPLTIAEGQLLGRECCHRGPDGKTNADVKAIAKGKRQNAKHIRIVSDAPKLQGQPFATTNTRLAKQKRAAEKLPLPDRSRLMFAVWPASTNPEHFDD